MTNAWSEQRHKFLVDSNLDLLDQAVELLERTSDAEYVQSPDALQGQRIGSHIRHVLEFYGCFLDGLRICQVDYDARRRDTRLESDRRVAIAAIRALMARLVGKDAPLKDSVLFVRVEDAGGCGLNNDFLVSSVGRELQALSSHTVHHFGLIAMLARLLGIPVADDFGVARSTLRFRATQRSEAA